MRLKIRCDEKSWKILDFWVEVNKASHSEVRRVFGNRVDTRYLRALTAARRTDKHGVGDCQCVRVSYGLRSITW